MRILNQTKQLNISFYSFIFFYLTKKIIKTAKNNKKIRIFSIFFEFFAYFY